MTYDVDVAIIGAGPAGIFTAYELITKKPNLKIMVFESGNDIYSRKCPMIVNKSEKCLNCNPCNIMRGFGGAGAFSDGKYTFTTAFGGWLNEYLSDDEIMSLIDYVDSINLKYCPNKNLQLFTTNDEIKTQCLKYDLHLLEASVRHLGTENNLQIMTNIYEFLQDKVNFKFNTNVKEILSENQLDTDIGTINCMHLVCAPGRSGSSWFKKQCNNLGLSVENNRIDLGVRVECPDEIMTHITDKVYEAKIMYRTKNYGDIVRTFCMNPHGHVVSENTNGIITVNGHSYADPNLQSNNTNFALLVSNKFTEPFQEPNLYGERIASLSNLLGNGVIVQRLGDLLKGRRTNEHRMSKSFTKPTLNATPGDLSLVLPKRHLDNVLEMLQALNNIAPGMMNDDTLLYGVEVKFYSCRVKLDNHLQTDNGIYAIGDGSGTTRGLSQASASGVFVARNILQHV